MEKNCLQFSLFHNSTNLRFASACLPAVAVAALSALALASFATNCGGPLHSREDEPGYVEGEIEPDGIDASDELDERDEPGALAAPEKFPGGVFQHDGDIRIRTSADGLRIVGGYDSAIGGHLPDGEAQFTCQFHFVGKRVAPSEYGLLAYVPGEAAVRRGKLQLLGPRVGGSELLRYAMRFEDHPAGGCWNVMPDFNSEDGALFSMRPGARPNPYDAPPPPADWRGVAKITAERAYFHDQPDAETRRRAYVVQHDLVLIHGIKGAANLATAWMEVSFPGERATTRGWIRVQDLRELEW